MGEVVYFRGITKLDMPAEKVLKEALKADLKSVILCGFTKEGDIWASSSVADAGHAMWLIEMFRKRLLDAADSLEENGI